MIVIPVFIIAFVGVYLLLILQDRLIRRRRAHRIAEMQKQVTEFLIEYKKERDEGPQ